MFLEETASLILLSSMYYGAIYFSAMSASGTFELLCGCEALVSFIHPTGGPISGLIGFELSLAITP
jgi:hypothetical protein